MRPGLSQLRNRGTEAGLAGVPAGRDHVWRAALRDVPVEGREGDERGESVHGRAAAHDAAGDVRDQRRGARDREPVASLAGFGVRSDTTPEWKDAALVPDHPGPRFMV